MADKTILVDMDDVLEDLLGAWISCLNKKYGTKVTVKDITEWNITRFFPNIDVEKIYEPLHTEKFWETVKPKKDAVKYISLLKNEGFKIYVCTASHYGTIKNKLEKALFPYFTFFTWHDVIIAHNKSMISADFLIDDGPHNLIGGNYKGILFDMPHNRNFKEKEYGIIRCSSWKEIYETIHNMKKGDNI